MTSKKSVKKKGQPAKAVSSQISYHKWIPPGLIAGALLLYGWTSTFSFGLDDSYVLNTLVHVQHSLAGLPEVFRVSFNGTDYRPVLLLSFWLERWVVGEIRPGTAHLVNVLLYGLLLTQIFRFIRLLIPESDPDKLVAFAFLTCLLFLVHPNHTGVVANIKSRDNLLSMLFVILAYNQFIIGYDRKQYARFVLFLIFILCGIFSKLDALPLVIGPILFLALFRQVAAWKLILAFVVFYIAMLNLQRLQFQSNQAFNTETLTMAVNATENPLVLQDNFLNRLSLGCISFLYYLKFLFVPFGYYFYYGYNQVPLLPLFHPLNILAIFLGVFITGLSAYYFRRNRLYLFAWLFFLLAIGYALNILQPVAGIVAERYNFIASLGFCMAAGAWLTDRFKITHTTQLFHKWIILLLVIYAGFTIYRTTAWKDELTLYKRDIPHLDNSYNAQRIISATYLNMALDEAQKKDFNLALGNRWIDTAEIYANNALNIYDKSPSVWEIKGIIDLYRTNNAAALKKFYHCQALDSNYLSAVNYIGVVYRNLNNFDSAYYYFNKVMQKESFFNYSAGNLIDLLYQHNKPAEADSLIRVLLQRFPNDQSLKRKLSTLPMQQR